MASISKAFPVAGMPGMNPPWSVPGRWLRSQPGRRPRPCRGSRLSYRARPQRKYGRSRWRPSCQAWSPGTPGAQRNRPRANPPRTGGPLCRTPLRRTCSRVASWSASTSPSTIAITMTAAGQKPCSQPAVVSIANAPTIPATVTTCINPAVAPESRRRAQSPGSPVANRPPGRRSRPRRRSPPRASYPWWALANACHGGLWQNGAKIGH